MHMKVRRAFMGVLVLTLLSTGLMAWLERSETVSSLQTTSTRSNVGDKSTAKNPGFLLPPTEIPGATVTRHRPLLPPPARDIFTPEEQLISPPTIKAALPEAPAQPPPPVLDVKFLGSFTDPEGRQILYLAQGEKDIEAKVGEILSNGFMIVAADAQAIHFSHVASNTVAKFLISSEHEAHDR